MKRKCIICGKVIGESGDPKDHSVTGSICSDCETFLEAFYYCRQRYRETGLSVWKDNAESLGAKILEREKKKK